jgi:hypothetical protein
MVHVRETYLTGEQTETSLLSVYAVDLFDGWAAYTNGHQSEISDSNSWPTMVEDTAETWGPGIQTNQSATWILVGL